MKKNMHSEQQKFFIQRQTSLSPSYKKWLPIREEMSTKALFLCGFPLNFILRRHCEHRCLITELKSTKSPKYLIKIRNENKHPHSRMANKNNEDCLLAWSHDH